MALALSGNNSDLTGASINKKIEATPLASSQATGTIATSGGTVTWYFFTDPGLPGTTGLTGNYEVNVNITTGTANAGSQAVYLARVNSSGTVQQESSASTISLITTASHRHTFTNINLGTWASGDRLRIRIVFTNSNTMTAANITIGLGSACLVMVPWDQNRMPGAEDFSAWSSSQVTTTTNNATAPNGASTADTVMEVASSNVHQIVAPATQTFSVGDGLVAAVFIKPIGSKKYVRMYTNTSGGADQGVIFDLQNGKVYHESPSFKGYITPLVGTYAGWFRLIISYVTPSAASTWTFALQFMDDTYPYSTTTSTFLGSTSKGANVWGYSLNLGNSPSDVLAYPGVSLSDCPQPPSDIRRIMLMAGGETGDWYEFTGISAAPSGGAYNTTVQRSGRGCYQLNGTALTSGGGVISTTYLKNYYLRYSFRFAAGAANGLGWTPSFRLRNGSTDVNIICLAFDATGIRFAIYNGSAYNYSSYLSNINADTWHTVEAVREGTTITGYLNGTQVHQVTGIPAGGQTAVNTVFFQHNGDTTGHTYYWDDIVIAAGTERFATDAKIVGRGFSATTPTYDAWTKVGGTSPSTCWNSLPTDGGAGATRMTGASTGTPTSALLQSGALEPFNQVQSGRGSETLTANDSILAVKAVQVIRTSALTTAGNQATILRIVDGDLVFSDGTVMAAITTDYPKEALPFEVDSLASLNAMEIGSSVLHGTPTRTVADIYPQVLYIPGVAPPILQRRTLSVLGTKIGSRQPITFDKHDIEDLEISTFEACILNKVDKAKEVSKWQS